MTQTEVVTIQVPPRRRNMKPYYGEIKRLCLENKSTAEIAAEIKQNVHAVKKVIDLLRARGEIGDRRLLLSKYYDDIKRCVEIDKLSVDAIAKRLGLTRNQVSGSICRMRKRGIIDRERVRRMTVPTVPATLEGNVIFQTNINFQPPEGKISVANVEYRHCRWLDDDGYFCGERKKLGSSFCAHHHAICWTPTRRQISERRERAKG